ncbi:hypothetical protein B0H16DRAFT_1578472 [Mycena metata]|uniref:Uncharacterized protein n=1 Tax=Mycena metata TaxID=1033252 RepID=A0AAD7I314_9AGAR|nr:hypothetical protein B0H16DRAFT_1578472 [Mycena metata]
MSLSSWFSNNGGQSTRKFVDLIHREYAVWPNLRPEKEIRVGDYGLINKRTGEWEADGGNIYTDPATVRHSAEHPSETKPKPPAVGGHEEYISSNVTSSDATLGPEISIPGGSTLYATVEFKYANSAGAVIFLVEFQRTWIPDALLKVLSKDTAPHLAGKSLVTDVTSCRACFMQLSRGVESNIQIEFKAQAPLTVGSAGGGVRVGRHPTTTAAFEKLCNFTEDRTVSYFPLFSLKRRTNNRRWENRRSTETSPEHDWETEDRPWMKLGKDGAELASASDTEDEDSD